MTERIKYIIGLLILVFIFQSCTENVNSIQENSESSKISKSSSLTNSKSFDTLAIAYGDLNSDNISDLVIILTNVDKNAVFDSVPKRPIQILFGNKNHSYDLFCSSENIVMTIDMGGASTPDPFTILSIEKGKLIIVHHGGMGSFHWAQTAIFKYSVSDKKFYVHQLELEEGRFSEIPSDAYENNALKTEKDFGKFAFDKYNVFKNREYFGYN